MLVLAVNSLEMGDEKKPSVFLDPKGRQDHIVPQVYLRGFIHPDRNQKDGPLEVFELERRAWGDPRTSDQLCTEIGFYDYNVDVAETTADEAFKELEDGLYKVRKELRDANFNGWAKHRDFLLRFGKMLAVRTKLFRERLIAERAQQQALRVLDVKGTTIRYEVIDWKGEPGAEHLLKNLSITEMRREIEKGAEEWSDWKWSLYVAPSIECPFMTSDHPAVMSGNAGDLNSAYREGAFEIVIPFGRDFTIAGGPKHQDPEGPLVLRDDQVTRIRRVLCSPETKMLISPIGLPDMRWVDEELSSQP